MKLLHGGMNDEEMDRLKRELTNKFTKVVKFSEEQDLPPVDAVVQRVGELYAMGFTLAPGPSGLPSAVYYALASLDTRPAEDDGKLFITRNEEFLAQAERLFERFGVRPVTPEEARQTSDTHPGTGADFLV